MSSPPSPEANAQADGAEMQVPALSSVYSSDAAVVQAIAESMFRLLFDDDNLVLRRKERVALLDEAVIRRSLSVDYELPNDVQPIGTLRDEDVRYAPLFFLQKGSEREFDPKVLTKPEPLFANFDFRDAGGKSLSLPPRVWNAQVTGRLLTLVVVKAAARQNISVDDNLRGLLEVDCDNLAASEQLAAVKWLSDLRNGRPTLVPGGLWGPDHLLLRQLYTDEFDSTVRRMLDVCAIASVVAVPLVGSEARSGIVKLSYDEQLEEMHASRLRERRVGVGLGWFGFELWFDTPWIGGANYHFEMQAPDGTEIYDAGLVGVGSRPLHTDQIPDRSTRLARASGFATRVHLYAKHHPDNTRGLAWVRLRARRQEFVTGGLIAAFVVMAALWLAFKVRSQAAETPASVPTLLLLFPGALAAYVVRPGVHRVTQRMLRFARVVLMIASTLPFFAASAFAVADRDPKSGHARVGAFSGWWRDLAIAATVAFVLLLIARCFPQPSLHWRRTRRAARWLRSHMTVDVNRFERPPRPEPLLAIWRRRRDARADLQPRSSNTVDR